MQRVLDYLRGRFTGLADTADRALLDRFVVARDESAFTELVRRYGPLVWGTCRRSLADPRDAEDAFQATFLVLVRRAPTAARQPALGPWLYRVAALTARTVRRGNRRRAAVSAPLTHEVPAADPSFAQADARADLDAALLRLSEADRAAVVLCHLQGLSRQEAAAQLGCPEGTLSARLSRARTKLRDRLGNAAPMGVVSAALIVSTSRAAVVYSYASLADAGVSPAVAGLTREVLRMFGIKKLVVAALVAVGLGAAVVVPVTMNTSAAPPAPPTKTPSAKLPLPAPPKVPKQLLEKRLEAAQKVFKQNTTRYQGGVGLPAELFGWSERWLQAELALASNPADRVKALRDHLDRTREVERMAIRYAETGQGRQSDADAATYYRLGAEIRLFQEGVEPHAAKEEKGKPKK